ncbi:hypothetical protein BDZ94DRAFT_1284465 [Collybia nuda]|uniref:Carrier domain-containing protein n=1 Tax=Collybia nuda TaxID=64659 RepID=A0A9P6CEL3_9AGAR|nr:hypothetical protein BDZ94DRAFT_1284465 [Collybia nuda]
MVAPTHPAPVMPTDPLDLEDVLISDVYHQLAHDYPERAFAKMLNENDDGYDIQDITWGKLMEDVYGVAQSMVQLGMDNPTSNVVGILGTSGYWFYVNLVACWMNGWPVMMLSTRNSLPALESLLTVVQASAFLVDQTHSSIGEALKTHMPNLRVFPMATAHDGHNVTPPPSEAPGRPRSSVELDSIFLYTHTSGSSGHPKPVAVTHRQLLKQMRSRTAAKYAGSLAYAPVPLFHAMGLYSFTRWPISSGVVPIFLTAGRPVNGHTMLQHLKYFPGCISFLPPSLLEEVADKTPLELKPVRNCQRVFFGGAPINPQAAERLVKVGVPLVSAFGASELGLMTELDFPSDNHSADWEYVRFCENHYILHFLPTDESSLREVVFSPNGLDTPCVFNRQDPLGFSGNDVWSPHPVIPGIWKHVGRKDSVTVLSNGEKTDNKQLEQLFLEDPQIEEVVVFGTGKPLNGVLLKTSTPVSLEQKGSFVDALRPRIEFINSQVPHHSRLIRQMIIIADSNKPFVSTDKGTVRTKDTLSLYASEIDTAYASMDQVVEEMQGDISSQDIPQFVKDTIQRVTSREPFSDDADLFDMGIDSLHALQIRSELLPLLRGLNPASVSRNLVYEHPTISKLVEYVEHCREGRDKNILDPADKVNRIENCLRRFTEKPFTSTTTRRSTETLPTAGYCIILTGATGSLGCHVLQELLGNSDVKKILCFHRGPAETGLQRHTQAFKERSLPVDMLEKSEHKLEFVSCDLSLPSLGLKPEMLDFVRSQVTHIIHIAWALNFNWKLEHFERFHIAGVRHLIDLAMSSQMPHLPQFTFLSSIGAVINAPSPILERSFDDPTVASDQGYGEGKYVAERIVDKARESGLQAIVVRAGQLSGSTTGGHWAASEYIPTLFRVSEKLGCLPANLPEARWIPVDIAAKCILTLTVDKSGSQSTYHIENATPTPWNNILQTYIEIVGPHIRITEPDKWLSLVEQESQENQDISAVALIPFYVEFAAAGQAGTWAKLDVEKSLSKCPELDFGRISVDTMRVYLRSALAGVELKSSS